jgi:uncharacterized membrane protein YfcA
MLIDNPWFYVAALPAVLIVGISKSGFGGGLGLVSVPLLAFTVSPVTAAAIMLPILCAMDIMSWWAYRRVWDRRNLVILVPASLVGIAVGALTFRYMSDDTLRLLVGAIAALFTLDHWIGRRPKLAPSEAGVGLGVVCGAISGFTSFIANAGGPILQVYMLPQRLDKTLFVGTTVIYFLIINYVKLVPFAYLGLFSTENLTTSLVLLPLAPIGVWLGLRLHSLVSQGLFYRLMYVLTFAAGIKLIWDGLHLGARLGL